MYLSWTAPLGGLFSQDVHAIYRIHLFLSPFLDTHLGVLCRICHQTDPLLPQISHFSIELSIKSHGYAWYLSKCYFLDFSVDLSTHLAL